MVDERPIDLDNAVQTLEPDDALSVFANTLLSGVIEDAKAAGLGSITLAQVLANLTGKVYAMAMFDLGTPGTEMADEDVARMGVLMKGSYAMEQELIANYVALAGVEPAGQA